MPENNGSVGIIETFILIFLISCYEITKLRNVYVLILIFSANKNEIICFASEDHYITNVSGILRIFITLY